MSDSESQPPIRFCRRCVEPSTRPDSIFDAEGICFPCRYMETVPSIDWVTRRQELEELAEWGRQRNVGGYDCIIPVSGGKDSHRQAIYCRETLNLNPLLVTLAYPPEHQSARGARNIGNLINLGFDCIYISLKPETWRRMMRHSFFTWGNLYKSTELPLYASAHRAAIMYHIPLMVYGENPGLSWGSAGGTLDGNANRLKYNNTLRGGDLSWLLDGGFTLSDLYWSMFPSDADIERTDLRPIYLGYFIPDFNDWENGRIAVERGLERRQGEDAIPSDTGEINTWDALDDDFVIVNQFLKFLKFGFGKALESAGAAVRNNIMSRDEAVELIWQYDGKCADRYIRKLCAYLDISEEEFWRVADSYRNPRLWERQGDQWRLRFPITRNDAVHGEHRE
jgi:N-acetyl sugar amidotransferase